MNCKYCHLNTHYIDECPTIICKNCKKVGHPQWLCTQSKLNKKTNNINTNNKFSITDEITKKTNNNTINHKTIKSYLNLMNTEWGNLVD